MIHIVHNGTLYKVDTTSGQYSELTGGWGGTTHMVFRDNALFILCDGTLYKVNPDDGSYQELSGGWSGANAMG